MSREEQNTHVWGRREFLSLSALGALALVGADAAAPPGAAAASTPCPRLPGELSRHVGLVSRYGGTVFEQIRVDIKGDRARLFVPRGIVPGSSTPAPVLWLFHGAESNDDALLGGFRGIGERAVDAGLLVICQTLGGTLYSHPTAQQIMRDGYTYLSSVFSLSWSFLRGTSHGGALAVEALAADLIPRIGGAYIVNGVYDIEHLYRYGPLRAKVSVGAPFGYSTSLIKANNPARHASSAYTGTSLRVVYSTPDSSDQTTPPPAHAKKLLARAAPTAAEASARTHTLGHTTPGFADTDNIAAILRWPA